MFTSIKALDLEIKRAAKFLNRQLRKGLKPEDVFTQIIGSYGLLVHDSLLFALKKGFDNNPQ